SHPRTWAMSNSPMSRGESSSCLVNAAVIQPRRARVVQVLGWVADTGPVYAMPVRASDGPAGGSLHTISAPYAPRPPSACDHSLRAEGSSGEANCEDTHGTYRDREGAWIPG